MNTLNQLFNHEIVPALGWTILHSFWQGLLIVLLLTISLVVLRKQSSQLRYLFGFLALLALVLCSAGTFCWYYWGSASPEGLVFNSPMQSEAVELTVSEFPVLSSNTGEYYWQEFLGFLNRYLPVIVMIWVLGVLLLTLRFLAELAYVQRLKYQPGPLAAAPYQEILYNLADKMGIQKAIILKENIRINSPMVIGFLKPVILVPMGLLSNLSPAQVESILAHELAHIKRYDYVLNLLQSLIEIVLFFNPATWWIASFIRAERENCCDDMALQLTGNQLVFAQTLAKLEEYRVAPHNLVMGFHGQPDGVLARVKRILNSEEQFQLPYRLFWSCLILLGSIALFAFQQPPHPVQNETLPLETIVPSELETSEVLPETAPIDQEEEIDSEKINEPEVLPKPAKAKKIERISKTEASVQPTADSIPKNIKKLKLEMVSLEKDFRKKEMELKRKIVDIQSNSLGLQQQMQQMENEQMKLQYELEKQSQQIEINRSLEQKKWNLELNNLKLEAMELSFKMQQKELELSHAINAEDREKTQQYEKEMKELQQKRLEFQKREQEFEMVQQRKNLEEEKQVLQLESKRWELQKEAEIKHSSKNWNYSIWNSNSRKLNTISSYCTTKKNTNCNYYNCNLRKLINNGKEKRKSNFD